MMLIVTRFSHQGLRVKVTLVDPTLNKPFNADS